MPSRLSRPGLRRLGAAALVVATLGSSSTASAQIPADRSTEAQRKFDEGRSLLRDERNEEACAAFAASDALEPGVGVMMVLAACHEQIGRLATAHREYALAAERARVAGDGREATARASAAELAPRVPVLVVRSDGPPGLEVTRDDVRIEVGTRVLLDPGAHRLVLRAPGHAPREIVVTLEPGQTKEVVLPPLTSLAPEPAAADDAPPIDPGHDPPPSSTGAPRVLGWIAVGLGGAGLALGSGAGLSALGQKADLEEDPRCPDACRDAGAVDSYNGARTVSTIGFVAGAALLAGGVVLVLAAPDAETTGIASTALTLGPTGATAAGRFW